jgi:hypothetical protein
MDTGIMTVWRGALIVLAVHFGGAEIGSASFHHADWQCLLSMVLNQNQIKLYLSHAPYTSP